jgi:hypothetical protein
MNNVSNVSDMGEFAHGMAFLTMGVPVILAFVCIVGFYECCYYDHQRVML